MHVLATILFAFFVAVVFAIITKHTLRERLRYGLKVFFAFLGIGLALAWIMYPFS